MWYYFSSSSSDWRWLSWRQPASISYHTYVHTPEIASLPSQAYIFKYLPHAKKCVQQLVSCFAVVLSYKSCASVSFVMNGRCFILFSNRFVLPGEAGAAWPGLACLCHVACVVVFFVWRECPCFIHSRGHRVGGGGTKQD